MTKDIPSADGTAANIILSGCILSCSGDEPTEVNVAAACPADTVSLCEGLIAIWIVGADEDIVAADEPQLTAGGLYQHNSSFCY